MLVSNVLHSAQPEDDEGAEDGDRRSAFPDAVTDAAHGLNDGACFPELLPQPTNVGVDRASIDRGLVAPDFAQQAVPRLDLSPPAHQHGQELKFNTGQPHRVVTDGDPASRRIERNGPNR